MTRQYKSGGHQNLRGASGPVYDALVASTRGTSVVLAALALAWCGIVPASVAAQPRQPFDRGLTMDLQLFLPPPGGGATFTIDDASVPRHMTFVVGLGFNHAAGVLERENTETDEVIEIVPRLTQIELLAAIGLFEVMEVGLAVPFVLLAAPPDPMTAISDEPMVAGRSGLSDPRITLKVPLLRGDFALAARAAFHIPIAGRDDAEQSFRSMGYWQSAWGAVATYTAGKLTLAGELAWRMRRRAALPGLEQDDELHLAAGLAYEITPMITPILETQIRIGAGGRELGPDESPSEADLGVRIAPVHGLTFDVGGGTGLRQGWGTPSWRVFLVARYATERETCPAGPEDYDGYEDGDYCNDPDNDRDQRPD
jgi:hypothetical protein